MSSRAEPPIAKRFSIILIVTDDTYDEEELQHDVRECMEKHLLLSVNKMGVERMWGRDAS